MGEAAGAGQGPLATLPTVVRIEARTMSLPTASPTHLRLASAPVMDGALLLRTVSQVPKVSWRLRSSAPGHIGAGPYRLAEAK